MAAEAKERDPVLRAAWFRKLANYHASQLVFLDESGFNSKLGRRTHGYGLKGEVIHTRVKSSKAENLSLLPAFTIDGYIACNVYKGGVSQEMFIDFLRQDLLPKCGRYPGPQSVIVMDNCRIHHSEA